MPSTRRQTIDLTQDEQPYQPPVIDLTQEEDPEEIVYENVTSILLTYPQLNNQLTRAGIDVQDDGTVSFLDDDNQLCQSSSIKHFFLNQLLQFDPQPAYVIVAQEKHKDEQPHIHCFVQWLGKRSYRHDYFDIHGMHPNIKYMNNPPGGKKYARKGGDFLSWVKTLFLTAENEGFFPDSPPPYSE